MSLRKLSSVLCLLLILGTAAFFRFYERAALPPGLYPDEAINGNDAIVSLRTGRFPVFYPENNGREGLFIWLIAASLRVFGPSVWALRLPSAVIGTLTVLGLYLLGRELFDRRIALWASFLLGVSFWHVNFSRTGFRAILVPLVMTFAFALLLHALRTRCTPAFLVAGACFGLGAYTYIAFRMAYLVLAVVLLLLLGDLLREARGAPDGPGGLLRQRYVGAGWWRIDGFLAMLLLTALPMVLYFARNPKAFVSRAESVSVFGASEPVKALVSSVLKTAGLLFVKGDMNWRHNVAGAPMVLWSVSPFVLLGIALALRACVSRQETGGGEGPPTGPGPLSGRRKALLLLAWLVIMLLPSALTVQGAPHALRGLGAIPAVFLLAGAGLTAAGDAMARRHRPAAVALLAFVAIFSAVEGFRTYFIAWGQDPRVEAAFRQDLVNMAAYLQALPESTAKFVITNDRGLPAPYPNGFPMPVQTPAFLMYDRCTARPASCPTFVYPDGIEQIEADRQAPAVFVFLRDEGAAPARLERHRKGGAFRRIDGFLTYQWPR